jgi:AcrR family transcriptional regulator
MVKLEKSNLDADDWLDAALDAFERGGVESVRIEPLAKALKVTRGSFYWHFADRDALLRKVLERWEIKATSRVIDDVQQLGGNASDRLLRLLETCARYDGKLDMALRSWANTDVEARHAINQVDQRRTKYIEDLLVEHGLTQDSAQRRSKVAYAAWIGEYTQPVVPSVEDRVANMHCLHRLIISEA